MSVITLVDRRTADRCRSWFDHNIWQLLVGDQFLEFVDIDTFELQSLHPNTQMIIGSCGCMLFKCNVAWISLICTVLNTHFTKYCWAGQRLENFSDQSGQNTATQQYFWPHLFHIPSNTSQMTKRLKKITCNIHSEIYSSHWGDPATPWLFKFGTLVH